MSNTSSLTLSADLQRAMVDKVREVIFGSLPDNVLERKILEEFNAFFDSPTDPFTVHCSNGSYSSSPTKTYMNVSPFRLIVWGEINKLVGKRVQSILSDVNSEFHKALTAWFEESLKSDVSTDYKSFVHTLSVANASSAHREIMRAASETVNSAFQAAVNGTFYPGSGLPHFTVIAPSVSRS